MRLVIDKITKKQINTKYGPKDKYGIQSAGQWYNAWANPILSTWTEGMEIDVEVKESQYTGRDGQTRTSMDIVFPRPEGFSPGTSMPTQSSLSLGIEIHEKLDKIIELLTVKEDLPEEDIPY